jgi:hypothetical protein
VASCVTMHKSMHLTSVGDCLYSLVCCSEGLEANPELESWIPTSPSLSPEWWTLLREFNNFYHDLMTDMFQWQVPGKGGAKGRETHRLRDALPGSIGSERRMGADVWMMLQAMFQLNMQRRRPQMMPSGVGNDMHVRARFTTYLKNLPGPTMNQIDKWNRLNLWRPKHQEQPEPVAIPILVPEQDGIEVPPQPIGPPPEVVQQQQQQQQEQQQQQQQEQEEQQSSSQYSPTTVTAIGPEEDAGEEVEQVVEPGAEGLSWARRHPRSLRVPRAGSLPRRFDEEEEEGAPREDGAQMDMNGEPRADQPEAQVQEEGVEQAAPGAQAQQVPGSAAQTAPEAQAQQVPEPAAQPAPEAQPVPDEEALQEALQALHELQEPEATHEPQAPQVAGEQAQQVPRPQAPEVPQQQAQQVPEPQAQEVPEAGPSAQAAGREQARSQELARRAGAKRKLPTPSTSSPPQPVRKSSRLAGERQLVMAQWVKGKPVALTYKVKSPEELTPPRPITHAPGPRGGSIPLKDTVMQPPTLVPGRTVGGRPTLQRWLVWLQQRPKLLLPQVPKG